jgi:hypothetical protein
MTKGKKRKKAQKKTSKSTSKEKEEVDYYALKKVPALVMWYLPVIDRLRCLFANPKDAKLMSWHASDEHKNDGKLRHPADGKQLQDFNDNHRDFADEPRNVRFALSVDGMNPFAERSSKHSTWSVILTIYNLPPWLMQKRKYILLTFLISGPTQPRVDMDVFLEPLMEDMKILWETCVQMLDEYRKDSFTLRAIIFVTINDYPALFKLSGQFKGKVGCTICIDETAYVSLAASKKIVYMRHTRFLLEGHRYLMRKMDKYFDNNGELHSTLKGFLRRAQNEFGLRIKKIRSDNGTEFKNSQIEGFLEEEGIKHEFSSPYTPQQNGVVERNNRTLLDMARTMLNEYKTLDWFWAEAINTACYSINRLYLHRILKKTSYELLTGKKPNVSYFRVFGSKCFILVKKGRKSKFSPKAIEGFLLGYDSNTRAYRVFNKSTGLVEVSYVIVFDETNGSLVKQVDLDDLDDEEAP